MTDLRGCEKETERCDMSLTSLPMDKSDTGVLAVSVLQAAHTSRSLHRDYP